MIQRRRFALSVPAVLLAGCGEAPKELVKKKQPEKPPEPVTGRYAFHQMYAASRAWAPDVQGIQILSIRLPEVKSEGGKFGAWQCLLGSLSKAKMKMFTFSVIEAGGNLHKGVFSSLEEPFSGTRGQAKPFVAAALRIDSDEAYQVAIKKAADFVKKNPDVPVNFLAELTPRFPNLTWRVMWGESVGTSLYSVFVDATTGQYLSTVR